MLQGLNEDSTGQPWAIWHCSTGISSHDRDLCSRGTGCLLQGSALLGADDRPWCQGTSAITQGLGQLLARVLSYQREPRSRHSPFGEGEGSTSTSWVQPQQAPSTVGMGHGTSFTSSPGGQKSHYTRQRGDIAIDKDSKCKNLLSLPPSHSYGALLQTRLFYPPSTPQI